MQIINLNGIDIKKLEGDQTPLQFGSSMKDEDGIGQALVTGTGTSSTTTPMKDKRLEESQSESLVDSEE